jgi:hypothetical protein
MGQRKTIGSFEVAGSGAIRKINMSDATGSHLPFSRALKAIAAGLEEIDSHFAWEGIAGSANASEDEATSLSEEGITEDAIDGSDDEPDDNGTYDEPYYTAGFDREDIEIAIDAFLSQLLHQRLIRKDRSGRLPSFSGVFAKFFGEEHQITNVADSFQDHIAGYFGWIDYENMRAAYSEFLEIQAFVKRELEKSGSGENKGLFDTDHPRED